MRDQALEQNENLKLRITELEFELVQLRVAAEHPIVSPSCDHDKEITQLQVRLCCSSTKCQYSLASILQTQLEISNEKMMEQEESLYAAQKQLQQMEDTNKHLRNLFSSLEVQLLQKEKELAASERSVEVGRT